MVAADERRRERGLLTGGERLDGLVDAVDELARADLVGDAAGGVDDLAVDRRGEVELHEVALARRALDRDERAEAGAQLVELCLHGVVADLDRVDGHGAALDLGEVEVGADVHLDLEHELAREVLDLGPCRDVGRGAAERAHAGLGDALAVELVDRLGDGLVEDLLAADALVDDRRGHLALAEAGHADLLGDGLVRLVDRGAQLLGLDRDGELGARVLDLLDRGLHEVVS